MRVHGLVLQRRGVPSGHRDVDIKGVFVFANRSVYDASLSTGAVQSLSTGAIQSDAEPDALRFAGTANRRTRALGQRVHSSRRLQGGDAAVVGGVNAVADVAETELLGNFTCNMSELEAAEGVAATEYQLALEAVYWERRPYFTKELLRWQQAIMEEAVACLTVRLL